MLRTLSLVATIAFFVLPTIVVAAELISLNPPLDVLQDTVITRSVGEPVLRGHLGQRRNSVRRRRPSAKFPKLHKKQNIPSAGPCAFSLAGKTGTLTVSGAGPTDLFVLSATNSFGEFGVTPKAGQSLTVALEDTSVCNTYRMRTTNGPFVGTEFPYLGGVVGFASTSDDLAVGSSNYVYFAGTGSSDPKIPPSAIPNSFTSATAIPENSEAAIWTIDFFTQSVQGVWTNMDGTPVSAEIAYASSDNVLLLVGDPTSFSATFGPSLVVTLKFVPTP